jgi:hypothetical protein
MKLCAGLLVLLLASLSFAAEPDAGRARYEREWKRTVEFCHEHGWSEKASYMYFNWSLDRNLRVDCATVARVLANDSFHRRGGEVCTVPGSVLKVR